jgi:UDP-2,3-diacylglucosamine pyrophosphatase LpxH
MVHEFIVFSDVHLGLTEVPYPKENVHTGCKVLSPKVHPGQTDVHKSCCICSILIPKAHLGKDDRCDKGAFSEFVKALSKEPPDNLIILGDLLDFWRKTNNEVLCKNSEDLKNLFLLTSNIYYVVGNHDYLISDLAKRYNKDGHIKFSKDLRLPSGCKQVYFTHGYDLDVQVNYELMGIDWYESIAAAQCRATNWPGGVASAIWHGETSIVNAYNIAFHPHSYKDPTQVEKIATSGTAHLFCGAQPGDLLVFGHTHRPFINDNKSVANTGSWCEDADTLCKNKVKYDNNTYVTIDKGNMELKIFDPQHPNPL